MFTIRLERARLEDGAPYASQSYTVLQAQAYFVNRVPRPKPQPPGCASSETEGWRTQVEMTDAKGDCMIEYLGDGQMYERAFVMNDAGKTVDTIA